MSDEYTRRIKPESEDVLADDPSVTESKKTIIQQKYQRRRPPLLRNYRQTAML